LIFLSSLCPSLTAIRFAYGLSFAFSKTEYLPKIYQKEDADAVIINSNFAIDQKLSPKDDSIVLEKAKDNPYANLIAMMTASASSF
jgi:ABC-type metal ion transport system substrate-binding protein